MIFEALYESSRRGELILLDGGYCRYHLRRDGQLTILEIISQRYGCGAEMLARMMNVPGVERIVASCPADLEANDWYRRRGFRKVRTKTSRSGRLINVWQLS